VSASLSDSYLTTKQLSRRLGKSVHSLYQWHFHGRGPACVKAGNTLLYPIEEVERWEREQAARDAK
jgi:hypothetical protein